MLIYWLSSWAEWGATTGTRQLAYAIVTHRAPPPKRARPAHHALDQFRTRQRARAPRREASGAAARRGPWGAWAISCTPPPASLRLAGVYSSSSASFSAMLKYLGGEGCMGGGQATDEYSRAGPIFRWQCPVACVQLLNFNTQHSTMNARAPQRPLTYLSSYTLRSLLDAMTRSLRAGEHSSQAKAPGSWPGSRLLWLAGPRPPPAAGVRRTVHPRGGGGARRAAPAPARPRPGLGHGQLGPDVE
jgi:hypothetical protein